MNTLIFLAGCGVGCLVALIVLLIVLCFVTRGSKASRLKSEAHMDLTGELLRERNEIGKKTAKALQHISDWCENNWNLPKS